MVRTDQSRTHKVRYLISNGNRTEWSPIRSVIIRVINKIGRPRSGDVLLPIYCNVNKICDIYKALFKIKIQEIPRFFC